MIKKQEWITKSLQLFIPLIIMIFIYQKTNDYFRQLNWEIIFTKIPELHLSEILLIISLGFIASGCMIYYDVLFNRRLNLNIPNRKLIKYSWIANTFNNFFGFGGLTGASIRTALFQKHHPKFKEVIKTIAWSTPIMFAGVSVLLIFVLISGLESFIHFDSNKFLEPFLWGVVIFLPSYLVILSYKNKLSEKTDRIFVIKMLITSIVEWFSCFVVFYVISQILDISVSFYFLYGLFFVGKFIGVISMTPGGAGTFDIVILEGLKQHGVLNDEALLLVVLYRISYFILPWIIGFILSLTELGKEWFITYQKVWSLSEKTLSNISHKLLTILVFLSGLLLLSSQHNHLVLERIKFAEKILPNSYLELSLELSIAIGFLLILLSRGVYTKTKISFYLTFIALILGSFFTLSKGFELNESIILLSIAILLWLSKKNFTRKNYALKWEELLCWTLILIVFFSYYTYISFQMHSGLKIWEILKYRFNEMFIIFSFISLIFYLTTPKMKKISLQDDGQKEKILKHLEKYEGNSLSHMVFLDDKYIHWSSNEVLFMYQTIADKIIVLGEPIGEKSEIATAIEEFQRYAEQYGMNVIFYQVSKDNLSMYHEKGYSFFKLGEESIVDLNQFSLSGKKASNLRNQMNKFMKNGYRFEVISPPFNTDILNQLQDISNEWLGKRKEKGFSMGYFNEEYLQHSSIAILKDEQDNIVAFSNLTPTYDSNKTLSLDLMRYKKDTPIGTMDVLFCHILDWSKQQGYNYFNLRMAPLSNVGISDFSFRSEKVAYKVYQYGSTLYGFAGLRKYKEKFTTNWESKYLAYRNRNAFTTTMIQVTLIIQKARKTNKNQ